LAGQGNLGNRPTGRTRLYKTTPIVTRVLLGRRREGDQIPQCVLRHVSGVWRHGDFIAMIPHTKGYIILGRRSALPCYPSCVCSDRHSRLCTSDGVLNPSGVRFGSGAICGVLERPEFSTLIDDAICVGQRLPQDKDERVLLFVKMRAGRKLDPTAHGLRLLSSPHHAFGDQPHSVNSVRDKHFVP